MISKKNLILIIASIGIFVEALDIAIVNLAIPSIQTHYGLTGDAVQWLQTLYVLLYGGFLIIGGKLSDVIGRKTIFMLGAALFLLTSLGAGLSPSFHLLAFFRAVQGLGAALIMPSAFSIVTHTFTEKQERAKAIGIFSSFAAIGSGSGLSLGGIIATYWGWQWVFFMNVPVLALVILLAWIYLEKDVPAKSNSTPDVWSGLLLVLSLLMLSYAVHELGDIGKHYWTLLALTGAIIGSYFVLKHRLTTLESPLIDLSVFKSRVTVNGIVVFMLLGAFFTGYLFLLSIMLQKDMQFSAARAGVTLVPFSILSALFAKFALPYVMKRLNIWQTSIVGMVLMLSGAVLLVLCILNHYNFAALLFSVACVTGLGMTICFTSLSVICVQEVEAKHYGLASSVATTSYFLGGGVGLSLLSLFLKSNAETASVTLTAVLVLGLYAAIGLVWLLIYNRRKSIAFNMA
ncbi:MFS transporter [Pedobacter sp. MC2016-24]|uniref:MFS transporter n=1 Tax=Pedobacter sp. MC2016-24 TaxID=2780090 RepID=UPI00187F7992|nr:MFS transporter [Pedobacter sp. MC2016-24]MBE9598282.1 MFS transporter [Pedobacter sp. MC2016-24]